MPSDEWHIVFLRQNLRFFFFLMTRPPRRSPLFPYTPLSRSAERRRGVARRGRGARRVVQCAHPRHRSSEKQVPAVNYRLEGEVAVLTIANPPVNALSLAVREGLLQGLQRAEQDRAVRSVVVTGADGTFAAGADINEVASGLVLKSPITREVQAKMEAGTKPIVAA